MSDSVQQIKDKLSIVDIVAPYVELHKAGKNYKGKSPFSAEKTPSFYVSPDRGMYYCFSTSQGGDMFNFIQAMEGVDFKGALEQLAAKAGVELVKEDPKKRTQRDRWYAALNDATTFYQAALEKEPASIEYLANRGVTPQTIAAWQIGYAPGPPNHGWREVKTALEVRQFTADELLTVGLIKQTDGGKEPFDVFRDRIVFPMSDSGGKVVAFSGRILHPDDKAPKYVNSPETPLYKKSELLYGYDKAKAGIRTLGFSLIVEGQFDVVMAHQAGYHNTVAVSGTALTPHHVQLLQRLSDKVVLALDADRAGIAAMKKSAQLMLTRGMDVKVVELPDGQDPADLIQSDLAQFKKLVGKSVTIVDFLVGVLQRQYTDQRQCLSAVKTEVYPLANLAPSHTEQYSYAKIIASRLSIPVDVVWRDMEHLQADAKTKPAGHEVTTVSAVSSNPQTDSARSAYVYLEVIKSIAKPAMATVVQQQLESYIPEHDLKISEAELAELSFTLENQIDSTPVLELQSEIVSKLNWLRKKLISHQLSVCKAKQQAATQAGDTDSEIALSGQVAKLAQLQSVPALTLDIFAKNN